MYIKKPIAVAVAGLFLAAHAWADEQSQPSSNRLTAPVVVTATRIEQNSFDLPVAIDVVEQDKIQDAQLQMTLSESLIGVPGITAQNRNQLAQDPQISIRGFGARSSFGVRGVRVYVDGIPLSMPDGIGQPGVVDLSFLKSIEVMRGPFSALYGSSSGGVINMLSEDAPKNPSISASALFGSYDTRRQIVKGGGTAGMLEYQVEASHFESDGYRDHSASMKDMATAKLRLNISQDTRITALLNWFDQPEAQDPLGLDRASAFSSPKRVHASAIGGNTHVARDHEQLGVNLEHRFNADNDISVMVYGGDRSNLQFLSTNATGSSGRASKIERDFWGIDAHWNNTGKLLDRPYKLTVGASYGNMDDDRLDINTTNGRINGTLNRDEKQTAWNFDQYAQAQWAALDRLDLHAGVRHTKVQMEVDDHLPLLNNDGSGNVNFEKTTPVVGAVFKVTPTFNLYANYGKGFETPTLIEVAYSDTAGNGPNLGLKSSKSDNYEIGAKAYVTDNALLNLALFKTRTEDEIVAAATSFGRTVYTNADKTSRKGAELGLEARLAHNFAFKGAYTLLDAEFDSPFSYTVNGTTNSVSSGSKLPGTYQRQIYAEVSWNYEPLGFSTALEGRHSSATYVNDANSEKAPSYTIFNLRTGFTQSLRGWMFKEYARIENIFDREYIGSVRVNDTNGRYYEPAPGYNWLVGLSAGYQF